MDSKAFLVFRMLGSLFAVEASVVREMLRLPEVTPIEETPPYIVGVINLRGKIIPVMDLKARFGHASRRYSTSNSIIVLDVDGALLGLIVDTIQDVMEIPAQDMEASPFREWEGKSCPRFVTRTARAGTDIIMVLDHGNLLDASEPLASIGGEAREAEHHYFCPEANPAERAIFHGRATALIRSEDDENLEDRIPLAVVGLSGEYFGVDIELVREFSRIRDLTPIPCCPPHIAGNMNLRGNILTLVDLRNWLNIPPLSLSPTSKVVVTSINSHIIGIIIDDLLDIIYVAQKDITPAPSAIEIVNKQYCLGTVMYRDRVLTMIDIARILMSEELIVNEEP